MLLWATIGLTFLKTVLSQASPTRSFPFLYLSADDNSTYYVEVTRYVPMDYLIDPVFSTDSKKVAVFQPFQQVAVKTDNLRPRPDKNFFSNCSAASVSTTGYAGMVCSNNNFVIISVDQVIAMDKFVATESNCSIGGDLSCPSVIFDDQITAGFVTCLKNNSESVSIVVYAFQFTYGWPLLFKAWTCSQIANTTMEEAGIQRIKVALTGVQYLNGSMPNAQIANVSLIVKPYSDNQIGPVFESIFKLSMTLQLKKNSAMISASSSGLHRITDLITQGFHISKIHCTTGYRFQYLFKSNCMLVTSLQNGLGTTQSSEVYFLNVSMSALDSYSLVKKVSMDFKLLTEIHVDDIYFLASSFNLTSDAYGTANIKLIDIYSVYSETFDSASSLIYETLSFDIGILPPTEKDKESNLEEIAEKPHTTPLESDAKSFKSKLYANNRMAIIQYAFEGGFSFVAAIDLDSMSAKRFNITGLSIDVISLVISGDEPLFFFNRFDNTTNSYGIAKTSNSKAYISISSQLGQNFSYFCTLQSIQGSTIQIQSFFLNGTFIQKMGSFIEIRSEFFKQNFTYYSGLDYNFYLPWENVRGADISLKDRPQDETSPGISSFKYFNQNVILDGAQIITPESYFICEEYLVLMDKNTTGNSLNIMIFKFQYQTDQDLYYTSVNNQTIFVPKSQYIVFSDTSLRTVKVYYSNIICLLMIHTYIPPSGGSKRLDLYTLQLIGYFGPNYLQSSYSIVTDTLNVEGNLQLQNQTSCIFVICSTIDNSAPVANPYIQVWRFNPEDLTTGSPLARFGSDSNIQPTFCPTAINQDLIDSKYIIVKSWCGGSNPTYSMKLDIETLQVSEFLNDRLINKTGDICPSRASLTKIYQNQLIGYTSSAGKGIVNQVSYFVGDLDLTKPYDKKCFINQNLLVIGQRKVNNTGPYYAVYFFHTDKEFEADKRLDQRIIIPGNVGVVTIYSTDTGAHVQYTLVESSQIGRITVQLSKTTIVTNLNHNFTSDSPFNSSIYFEFFSKGDKTITIKMEAQYEKPIYTTTLKKVEEKEILPLDLNNTLLSQVAKKEGPIFRIDLVYRGSNDQPPLLQFPYIEDLVEEPKVIIKAPIISSFDIFKSAGAFVIGIVNYPYGFDICIYDKHYLQVPAVTSVMGIVALNIQVVRIQNSIYLLVHGNPIGDSSVGIFTYKANTEDTITEDTIFEPTGRLHSL